MKQLIAKNTQDSEKSKFGYGHEKMKEEQNHKIEPTETTNDIGRVTTNTPCHKNGTPPNFSVHHNDTKRTHTDEKRQQERLHYQQHKKSTQPPSRTREPKRTRSCQNVYREPHNIRQLQEKPLHRIQHLLQTLLHRMENAKIQPRSQKHSTTNQRKNTDANRKRRSSSFDEATTKHGDRTQARRNRKTQSQRHRLRTQNRKPNNSQGQ